MIPLPVMPVIVCVQLPPPFVLLNRPHCVVGNSATPIVPTYTVSVAAVAPDATAIDRRFALRIAPGALGVLIAVTASEVLSRRSIVPSP